MKTTHIAGLLALALAAPLSAEQAQKQAPPQPGKPKDFQIPASHRWTLDNGMAVTLVPYGTVPKVTVRLAVRTGAIDEAANQVWLSDLTGTLLTQGTSTRSATQIAEDAAKMGGSLDVTAGADRTDIGGDVLSESGPDMVALVADVALHPVFPEKEAERLKGDMARRLAIAKSQAQQQAAEKFSEVLYGDHPYGRLFPTSEMLAGYTAAQARAFYEKNYGARRAHLYVAGRFDEKAMEAAIRKAFSAWKAGSAPTVNPPHPSSVRGLYQIDRPGAVQSTLNLGLPVIDPSSPDYVPLVVTNTLLGGSFASRITSNIREQKGYTYSPFSQIATHYRDGHWVEIADVTTNVTGPAIKEVLGEIERLQAEPPSDKELKGFQNYQAGVFVLQNSSRPGIIGQLEFVDLHSLPADYLNGYVARVYAVTPQQVQETAKKYLQDDKATIVVVGDKKVIEEQLKPFGTVK